MREPTCTPRVVLRIAFYNREILPCMLVTFCTTGREDGEEPRANFETRKRWKSGGTRTRHSCVKRKNEFGSDIVGDFSYEESTSRNSHVLARRKGAVKSQGILSLIPGRRMSGHSRSTHIPLNCPKAVLRQNWGYIRLIRHSESRWLLCSDFSTLAAR